MNDRVSIIIPVYKTEQYLAECMESVLKQQYDNLEIILVDDGSPDKCPALCDTYGKQNARVKVVHQTNQGPGPARNTGIEVATGSYIMFLDSDDCLEGTEAVKILVEEAKATGADIVQGAFRRFGAWGMSEVNVPQLQSNEDSRTVEFRFKGFYRYGHLAYNWGKLYRREFLLENHLKWKAYPIMEDKVHNMSCYAYGPVYAFVQDCVYCYRENEASVTAGYQAGYMPLWISVAADFADYLEEQEVKEDLGDLLCFHIFFGCFFLAKQELQFQKHGIRAAAGILKDYGKHPFVKARMKELARGRYLKEIQAFWWKLVIFLTATLFCAHGYLPIAAGIAFLRKLEIDSRITKSRYQEQKQESTGLCEEERRLLAILQKALKEQPLTEKDLGTGEIHALLTRAKRHAVLPLLYEGLRHMDSERVKQCQPYIAKESQQTVLQSYRLLFLTRQLIETLREQHIPAVVLKGVATAGLYPTPEMRKSGDVDLLISPGVPEKKLRKVMENMDFQIIQDRHANHHMIFTSPEGIYVELHTQLAEPFADRRINEAMGQHLEDCLQHVKMEWIMGVELPVLDLPYHAFELLLHMLQHFMYAGFGLKLLCDWVMLWRQGWTAEEKELFLGLAEESGLMRFAQIISAVCVEYLGLDSYSLPWEVKRENVSEEFLREIFAAEEFGKTDKNRLLMMNGTGLWAYIREFQHQMHLNFPMAGRCFLLWPLLWGITLVRFLRNNRKVRQTSAGKVLREASRRSKLIKKMGVFEK